MCFCACWPFPSVPPSGNADAFSETVRRYRAPKESLDRVVEATSSQERGSDSNQGRVSGSDPSLTPPRLSWEARSSGERRDSRERRSSDGRSALPAVPEALETRRG